MRSLMPATGSAERWGPRWGARPADWARNEEQQAPTYERGLDELALAPGARVLDIGCGTGVFLRLAADRGARVSGIDASEALIEIARERVPEAELDVGDMQLLPYDDHAFDAVTGFNSFFFAADMAAALREARRVAKPGAAVVIQVWGRPERCDLDAMKQAIRPFLGPPPPGAPAQPALWRPGVLEDVAAAAGLAPEGAFDIHYAFEYPDEDTLGRMLLSPGLLADAIANAGEDTVRTAIVEALSPHRRPDGTYSLENEWHFLVARA